MFITHNGQQVEVQLIIDLSRGEWNPVDLDKKVNFSKAKAAGIVAAWFRDANGQYDDKTAPTFEQDADAVGIPWGDFGTIYADTKTWGSIPQQASEFIANAKISVVGRMPLVIDWEVEGVTWQMAMQYTKLVMAAFPGKEIWIYSRKEFLDRYLPNKYFQATDRKWFMQFPVWQAQYSVTWPTDLPDGFTRGAWQVMSNADASLYGVHPLEAKGCDITYWFGSYDQFCTRFGLLPTPPDPPDPQPTPDVLTRLAANEAAITQLQSAVFLAGKRIDGIDATIAHLQDELNGD